MKHEHNWTCSYGADDFNWWSVTLSVIVVISLTTFAAIKMLKGQT